MTSKKQMFCLDDMPIVKSKKNALFKEHNSSVFFKSHEKVAEALLQSLKDNDVEAFLEILDAYLKNKYN